MTPNLQQGNTEILFSLRGRHVRRHKIDLFGPASTGTLPIVTEHQTYQISVTNNYICILVDYYITLSLQN